MEAGNLFAPISDEVPLFVPFCEAILRWAMKYSLTRQ